jgi:hypothetical protein
MHRHDSLEKQKGTPAPEPSSKIGQESPVDSGAVQTPERDLRSSLRTIWLRLITLGVVAMVFSEALMLAPGKAQGWSYYLTGSEVFFEVFVRLVAAALAGMAVGSVLALVFVPFLWFFPLPAINWSIRQRKLPWFWSFS